MISFGSRKIRLLIVGQTPPPWHGQGVMIKSLVDRAYESIEFRHVRMNFSYEMGDVGKFRWTKLPMLVFLVLEIWYWRLRGFKNLYYPPASGNLVPILRDAFVLSCTRPLFDKTVFHFHAGDITRVYDDLPFWLKPIYRWIYFHADLGITVASKSGVDTEFLRCKKVAVIPNAVADQGPTRVLESAEPVDVPTILYVGALIREKGLLDLIEAARLLADRNIRFRIHLVGEFREGAFQREFHLRVQQLDLQSRVSLLGRVECDEVKKALYRSADVFCFPTYYPAETFGIVLIEAMSSGLPIVATNWRSIPDTLAFGTAGLLVEPRNPVSLADQLSALLTNPSLRAALGKAARDRYANDYTLEKYRNRFETVLNSMLT